MNIIEFLNQIWTQILDVTALFVTPDWAFLISLGYPAGRPLAPIKTPDRRPFDEVVHHDRWAAP